MLLVMFYHNKYIVSNLFPPLKHRGIVLIYFAVIVLFMQIPSSYLEETLLES